MAARSVADSSTSRHRRQGGEGAAVPKKVVSMAAFPAVP